MMLPRGGDQSDTPMMLPSGGDQRDTPMLPSGGDQRATPMMFGMTSMMQPLTPDLAGSPT